MHHVRPDHLEELGEALDQQRLGHFVPPVIVAAREEQIFARAAVEPGDARARLVERGHAFIDGGEQRDLDIVPRLQTLEQLVADLLRAAAQQFRVPEPDQENLHDD